MKGLVLEGGGAKGSYHIGAYKAILEEGIHIDGITGTSIGALNGAMIAQGDFELCYELWENIHYSMLVDINDKRIKKIIDTKFNKEDFEILVEKLKKVIKDRGFDITPFKKHLDTYIDEERVRKSKMDFGMVTVNITDFKPVEIFIEDIPKGKLKEYLLASSYLPIFKMERLGGKLYLDGGFYDNLPFKLLQKKGYKDLILVRTSTPGFINKINTHGLNATIISPSDDIGRSYDINPESAKRNIQLGYYDALRTLRGLCGKSYCIKPEEDTYYIDFLLSLKDNKISEISELLNISGIPEKRALFECIVPRLASILDLDNNFSYEDLLVALLEVKAKGMEVNKFEIYTFDQLINIIKRKGPLKIGEKQNITTWDKLIDKVDLPSFFNKEELTIEIANIVFDE